MILLSELIGNDIGFLLLGAVNRVSGRRLGTVFLVYPAHPKYATAVTFAWYTARGRWQPRFIGIYAPAPGQWGLVFAVSSSEQALTAADNESRLLAVLARLERIKDRVGAKSVALSGILPSHLRAHNLRQSDQEREQTAAIVEQAVFATLARVGLEAEHPVFVLGSAGYIGSRVFDLLQQRCPNPMIGLDTRNNPDHAQLLHLLEPHRDRPALLVNISRHHVLELFIPSLWPQVTILNEVFPEADRATRNRLQELGIDYFHLAGIRGFALPKFAGPYGGAIPCCALSLRGSELPDDSLVIRHLNP